jgi:O-antigen ligase
LRARWLPLALFGLYAVWSYVSALWAQVPADALDGANRTLVYWLAFALFAGLSISERVGGALVLAWGVALAALGLVALVEAGTATATAGHFVEGRLAAPLSYPDGDAALFLSACLALIVLASRPRASGAARLTAGAAAVVLVDLAVLCQSRGSLIWFPCALILYLAVASNRLRAFAHLVVAAAAVAPAASALLHVYSAVVAEHDRRAAVMHAATWIAGSAALGVLGMVALLLFERHITLSVRARFVVGSIVSVAAGAAVVAAAVIAVGPHPLGRAERGWRDFTTNKKATTQATPHFSSGLGTSRYDVWRIALREFAAHPLNGVGSDNYLVGYLRQRRTHETSRYPTSVELRAFSETGIVGAALFLGFLGLVLSQAFRAARRSRAPGVALACFVSCGYWLFHSSTDWFWELPALTGAALALLAIASAPARQDPARPTRRRLSPWSKAVAAAAAVATAAVFTIPWASDSLVDAATARGAGSSAYSLLHTAARLNPWSERPALAEATLAANAGDRVRERQALLEALRRNPHDWYPHLMLGIVAGREHHDAVARRELAQARRMSPEDLVVSWAQTRLSWGLPLTERQVGEVLQGS